MTTDEQRKIALFLDFRLVLTDRIWKAIQDTLEVAGAELDLEALTALAITAASTCLIAAATIPILATGASKTQALGFAAAQARDIAERGLAVAHAKASTR